MFIALQPSAQSTNTRSINIWMGNPMHGELLPPGMRKDPTSTLELVHFRAGGYGEGGSFFNLFMIRPHIV